VSLVILIDQQVQTKGFHIVFRYLCLSCLLINLIGIASLLIREQVGQLLHLQMFCKDQEKMVSMAYRESN